MTRHLTSLVLILLFITALNGRAQLVKVADTDGRQVDTILLEQNWRTHNAIILSELTFQPGDRITPKQLEQSLRKIWNLQQFSAVSYRWDTLGGGRNALVFTAKDALTIAPVFSAWSHPWSGYAIRLGVDDRNVLGRNIHLEGRVQFGTPSYGELKVTIPRQLLYRNMTLSAGYEEEWLNITDHWYTGLYEEASYSQFNARTRKISLLIGNPFHEDFHYTFSPDLKISRINTAAVRQYHASHSGDDYRLNLITQPLYLRDYLEIRLIETAGTITHRLQREEGWQVKGETAFGWSVSGLGDLHTGTAWQDPGAKRYISLDASAAWHRPFTDRWQLSLLWEGHYTTSGYPTLWNLYPAGKIRGIPDGMIAARIGQVSEAAGYFSFFYQFDSGTALPNLID